MHGAITIKDLAVEVNNNGNYVVYAQHSQEGHATPVELRPIPTLVNQMCLVYDVSVGKFVPQDMATYVENTPTFKNKIQEVAGTSTLVAADGTAIVASVNVYADSTYLPLVGNNSGDLAFATDINSLFAWTGTAWETSKLSSATGLTSGTVAAARLDTATTQLESDDSTKIATTAYVVDKITTLIGGAPSTLNDLNELAAAINDDNDYNSTLTTALATKLPLAGGAMTGPITLATGGASNGDKAFAITTSGTNFESDAGIINITHAGSGSNTGGYFQRFSTGGVLRYSVKGNGDIHTTGTVDGVDIATRDAILTSTTTTAGAALPKAGGTMTNTLTVQNNVTSNTDPSLILNSSSNLSADNYIQMGQGATSNPIAMGFDNSTNKFKIARNSSGNISSGEHLTIDSSGNVGIGTSSPSTKLSVVNSGAGKQEIANFANNNSGTHALYLYVDNDANQVYYKSSGTSGGGHIFETGNTERMRITSAGNVGIGTDAPGRPLVISGNGPSWELLDAGAGGYYHHYDAGKATIGMDSSGSDGFYFRSYSGGYADRVVIKANGNVGIGTTNPSYPLDVTGDTIQNGVRTFTARFNVANNASIGFDVNVPNEGGGGNSFMIHCGHNHYYITSYGTHRIAMISARGTSISDVINVAHQTSGNGGSWTFSKPSSTLLRITKNAGSYPGGGAGFIHVTFSSFM